MVEALTPQRSMEVADFTENIRVEFGSKQIEFVPIEDANFGAKE